jgi:hypothetical protein
MAIFSVGFAPVVQSTLGGMLMNKLEGTETEQF